MFSGLSPVGFFFPGGIPLCQCGFCREYKPVDEIVGLTDLGDVCQFCLREDEEAFLPLLLSYREV